MEQVTDVIGNPTALLIERFFWLGIGGFLGLAIVTSLINGFNERKKETKPSSTIELENIAKIAIQQNEEFD